MIDLSISEAAELLRRKKISPVDLTTACLDRIERLNPVLNAFITVTDEGALAQARVQEALQPPAATATPYVPSTQTASAGDPDSAEFQLAIGPQPLYGQANVDLTLPAEGELSLQVLDVTGRSVAIDRDAFVKGAIDFLQNYEALARMSRSAAQHIRSHYTFDRQLESTQRLYAALAPQGPGAAPTAVSQAPVEAGA